MPEETQSYKKIVVKSGYVSLNNKVVRNLWVGARPHKKPGQNIRRTGYFSSMLVPDVYWLKAVPV